jgi:membrane protein implicated in regulation of membrane protease activity
MQNFMKVLETLNQWHWFGFAAVLTILEVSLGASFFLLWLGVSAATVGLIIFFYPQLTFEYQFIIFAIESIACLAFWNFHLKHNPHVSDQPNLNRRNHQYIGRVVTLDEPIINGRGRIHIDDSFWRVEGPDLPVGTAVKIIDVDGVVLKISKN